MIFIYLIDQLLKKFQRIREKVGKHFLVAETAFRAQIEHDKIPETFSPTLRPRKICWENIVFFGRG